MDTDLTQCTNILVDDTIYRLADGYQNIRDAIENIIEAFKETIRVHSNNCINISYQNCKIIKPQKCKVFQKYTRSLQSYHL